MRPLIIALFISGSVFAQKKDHIDKKDSSKVNIDSAILAGRQPVNQAPDSVTILFGEFLQFLVRNNVSVKDFVPIQNAVNEFIKEKELLKPKNTKK